MKKNKLGYFIVSASIIFVILVLGFIFTDGFSGSPLFWFATYDHIQYDGVAYYQAEDQTSPFAGGYSEPVVVYLVSSSSKVDYNHPYDAQGYSQDPERVHLFFDGTEYTRDLSLAAQYYKLNSPPSN